MLGSLLPVLVVGWLATAGPCVGMAAASSAGAVAPDAYAGPPAVPAADAGEPPVPAEGPLRHHHGDDPSSNDGPHAAGADPPAGAPHSHGACPHCPGSAGATQSAHAHCAALDDVSSAKREPVFAKLDLKPAPPSLTAAAPVVQHGSAVTRRPELYHRVFPPSVPLNLRHCVLIV